jgi:regulatory protein
MAEGPGRLASGRKGAFASACSYLTRRERCTAEVRDYLRRHGYPAEEIAEALRRLVALEYVDDLRYARLYVRMRSRNSPRSGTFLRRELVRRGIARETARQAVDELLVEVPEDELARRLIAKLPGEGKQWRERAARRLRARGFRPSLVLRGEGRSSMTIEEDGTNEGINR